MGRQFASDLADSDYGLSLENSIAIHLQGNHYPPVPLSMVAVCIKAIESFNEHMHGDELIELPKGISWRGKASATAWSVIESHHLDAWCSEIGWDE